ncbi:MAG: hypothetical protein ACXW3N_04165, partial [Rhodoplanes sp.]
MRLTAPPRRGGETERVRDGRTREGGFDPMKTDGYAAAPAVVQFPPRRPAVMPSEPPVAKNGLMAGKRGLVMGVA